MREELFHPFISVFPQLSKDDVAQLSCSLVQKRSTVKAQWIKIGKIYCQKIRSRRNSHSLLFLKYQNCCHPSQILKMNSKSSHHFWSKHTSLFYSGQSAVRSNNWDAAACNKHSFLSSKSIDSSCSQPDVAKENADSPRTGMKIPDSFVSEDVKQLSKSKSKISVAGGRKKAVCDAMQKLILPYKFLNKNCLPMPVSLIQDKCFSGEILCKIQHFRKEKRLQLAFETSSISTLHTSDGEQSVLIIIYGCLITAQMGFTRNNITKLKRRKIIEPEFQETAPEYKNSDITL